jgi:hypothetical protein
VGLDWTHLAQDLIQQQITLNMLMNFGFHKNEDIFDQLNDYSFPRKDSLHRNIATKKK